MKALTSATLNVIMFEVNIKKLTVLKLTNMAVEVQTSRDANEILEGLRLKWRLTGIDSTEKITVFHFLAEDTFKVIEPQNIDIQETRALVDKSYAKVVKELIAQVLRKAQGTIRMPDKADEEIVQRVHNVIQKSL